MFISLPAQSQFGRTAELDAFYVRPKGELHGWSESNEPKKGHPEQIRRPDFVFFFASFFLIPFETGEERRKNPLRSRRCLSEASLTHAIPGLRPSGARKVRQFLLS
jgi:hypothetical protein